MMTCCEAPDSWTGRIGHSKPGGKLPCQEIVADDFRDHVFGDRLDEADADAHAAAIDFSTADAILGTEEVEIIVIRQADRGVDLHTGAATGNVHDLTGARCHPRKSRIDGQKAAGLVDDVAFPPAR